MDLSGSVCECVCDMYWIFIEFPLVLNQQLRFLRIFETYCSIILYVMKIMVKMLLGLQSVKIEVLLNNV